MNVLYVADDGYAEILAVSLASLLDNNREAEELNIYIVEDKITTENKKKLETLCAEYGRQLHLLEVPETVQKTDLDLSGMRWSKNIFSRLFVNELFEEYPEIERVLYLDCDTLVVDALQELWETELSGRLGAACLECMGNLHKRIIGAPKTSNYINTGTLLIDVRAWAEQHIEAEVLTAIQSHKGNWEYPDQDIFNRILNDRFLLVSPRYNLTALAYDFTYEEMQIYRKPQFGYSRQEWEAAVAHPAVIHFTTSFLSIRPWFAGSEHPYAKVWSEYHARTPWKDMPPREMRGREKHERNVRLYHALPRWLAVRLAGFLHAYVKPIVCLLK